MAGGAMLGHKVRRLRRDRGVSQVDLAAQLGISPSYLNLIEHNQRQLTLPILMQVSRIFEVELEAFSDEEESRILGDLVEAFGDPLFRDSEIAREDLTDVVQAAPAAARGVAELYKAYRSARDNVKAMSERLSDDVFVSSSIHELLTLLTSIRSFSEILHDHEDMAAEERQKFIGIILNESKRLSDGVGQLVELARGDAIEGIIGYRLPAEEVSDFLSQRGNHFTTIDAEAESLQENLGLEPGAAFPVLAKELADRYGIEVVRADIGAAADGPAPRDDALFLAGGLSPESLAFEAARRIALVGYAELLTENLAGESFTSHEAEELARRALAAYFAGGLLMPYEPFTEAARGSRYDIERLQQVYGASFEQVCHRLTTLQRPGDAAVPFHFVRVDIAGNISKRFAGSGLRIPRFGGACPRWAVHAAFLTPGRIISQAGEMPDGSGFLSIARTVTKHSGGHLAPRSHFAVEIGCEISRAGELVYGDDVGPVGQGRRMPIGVSCRLCERTDCAQRAQPPLIPRGPASSGRDPVSAPPPE